MMKKLFALFTALFLLCAALPVASVSARNYTDLKWGQFYYNVNDGQVTIVDYESTTTSTVEIPETIYGNPVTTIGRGAFQEYDYCWNTTVILPDSVTTIGTFAFSGTGIETIRLSNNLKIIDSFAFSECRKLKSITLPDSLTEIGDSAFFCTGLTSITIPNKVTTIKERTFMDCQSLETVHIGAGVTKIEKNAFSGFTTFQMKHVYYAGSRESWEKIEIAEGNNALTYAEIHFNTPVATTTASTTTTMTTTEPTTTTTEPTTTTTEPTTTTTEPTTTTKPTTTTTTQPTKPEPDFTYETSWNGLILTDLKKNMAGKVEIPDEIDGYPVAGIGEGLFENCTAITSVELPFSVVTIAENAFKGCTGLTSITLPADLVFIGSGAFVGCESLTDVYYGGSQVSKQDVLWIDDLDNDCLRDAEWHYAKQEELPAPTDEPDEDVETDETDPTDEPDEDVETTPTDDNEDIDTEENNTTEKDNKDNKDNKDEKDSNGNRLVLWIVIGAVAAIAGGVALFLILRQKKQK